MSRASGIAVALLACASIGGCRQRVDVDAPTSAKPAAQAIGDSASKQPPNAKLADSAAARTWLLRARLDSGEVRAEVTRSAASMTVIAPTGTFLLAYPNTEPIEEWTRAVSRLRRAGLADGASESIVIRSNGDERVAWQLTRHAGRAPAPYSIAGTNSAWEFALDLSEEQLDAVLAALTGDSTGAAIRYEFPSAGRGVSGRPTVDGAWLYVQVDTRVSAIAGAEGLHYPPSVVGAPNGGEVKLSCIVGADGRVIPSSVFLILVPDPILAREARRALLRARFVPARRRGEAVPMVTQVVFQFGPS